MALSIKQQIAARGYAFMEYTSSVDTVAAAVVLGQPLTPWAGGLVQELVPRSISTPNTYSGIYGLDQFPFHTDLAHWRSPPRYLLLRCITGYTDVPTLLLDGLALVEKVTVDIVTRAIFKSRRPIDGMVALLRLCETIDNSYRLRWDDAFLIPASKAGNVANQRIKEYFTHSQPIAVALSRPGDLLLIDNWRILHSRPAIPPGREDRKLERIYLESLH